jgi:glutaredoxin
MNYRENFPSQCGMKQKNPYDQNVYHNNHSYSGSCSCEETKKDLKNLKQKVYTLQHMLGNLYKTRENYDDQKTVTILAPDWCGYSRKLKSEGGKIKQLLQAKGINLKIIEDQDEIDELSKKHGANGFPYTFIEQNGKKIGEISGYKPANSFFDTVNLHLNKNSGINEGYSYTTNGGNNLIKFYSMPGCGFCNKAKELLKDQINSGLVKVLPHTEAKGVSGFPHFESNGKNVSGLAFKSFDELKQKLEM